MRDRYDSWHCDSYNEGFVEGYEMRGEISKFRRSIFHLGCAYVLGVSVAAIFMVKGCQENRLEKTVETSVEIPSK